MFGDKVQEFFMKKYLYIMPAVLILMLYVLLAALAGGISGFQPIAFVYMLLPVAAGVLLRKDKWWGCFFGIGLGAVLLLKSKGMMVAFIAGLILVAYYIVMGLVCAASQKK